MTLGVGGSTIEQELDRLSDMTGGTMPISLDEYAERIVRAQAMMKAQGIDALYVNAGTNMTYFTGTKWHASERMVGAIIPAQGEVVYMAPVFEIGTLKQYMVLEGKLQGWQEHECPYDLFGEVLKSMGLNSGTIALDEATAFFITNGLALKAPDYRYINASVITAACRMIKSDAELALMQRAKDMTIEVHKAAAAILHEGISTTEVGAFIHEAHKKVGAPAGSYFVIVLFGEASAYPHGVKDPQILKKNDMVLIDTGCLCHGYISDITRTYVFGTPNQRQTEVWNAEKAAQAAAFSKAQIGARAGDVDLAARASLEENGFGPEYDIPGLPHRTGHGIGLDIHEWPYLNSGDNTILAEGMCFSNEPMICIPGEFGIRLEDHFYMAENGPKWFTEPSHSIEDPFGLALE